MKIFPALALSTMLAACATAPRAVPAPPVPLPTQRPISTVGLERVMGQTARALTGAFGAADADVQEGPARKLQRNLRGRCTRRCAGLAAPHSKSRSPSVPHAVVDCCPAASPQEPRRLFHLLGAVQFIRKVLETWTRKHLNRDVYIFLTRQNCLGDISELTSLDL